MGAAWAWHGHGMLCVNRPLVSRLTRTLRLNGLAVAGSWSPTKSGRYESSITVTFVPYAVWEVSICFLKDYDS